MKREKQTEDGKRARGPGRCMTRHFSCLEHNTADVFHNVPVDEKTFYGGILKIFTHPLSNINLPHRTLIANDICDFQRSSFLAEHSGARTPPLDNSIMVGMMNCTLSLKSR